MPSILPFRVNNETKIKNKGFIISPLIGFGIMKLKKPMYRINYRMFQKFKTTSASENKQINKAVKNIIETSKLKENGVKILKLQQVAPNESLENIREILESNKHDKRVFNIIKDNSISLKHRNLLKKLGVEVEDKAISEYAFDMYSQAKRGINSFYLAKKNAIIAPNKSFQTYIFHEIGHAINNNKGKLFSILRTIAVPLSMIPNILMLVTLLSKRKENKTSKQDNFAQKTLNFIKRNIFKLTLACATPKLLEEGIASHRGEKLAKAQLLNGTISKEVYNKIKMTNLSGFLSYIVPALMLALSFKVMVKVKDQIQTNYEKNKFLGTYQEQNNKGETLYQY